MTFFRWILILSTKEAIALEYLSLYLSKCWSVVLKCIHGIRESMWLYVVKISPAVSIVLFVKSMASIVSVEVVDVSWGSAVAVKSKRKYVVKSGSNVKEKLRTPIETYVKCLDRHTCTQVLITKNKTPFFPIKLDCSSRKRVSFSSERK